MKWKKYKIFIAGLAMTAGSLFGIAPEAAAVDGCTSTVVNKKDVWKQQDTWTYPLNDQQIWMTLSAKSWYQYCHNGSKPNKMRPYKNVFCWEFDDSPTHLYFDGVEFDAIHWDSWGRYADPGERFVQDDSNRKRCETQIFHDKTRWLFMRDNPRWAVSYQIVVQLGFDTNDQFYSTAGDKKFYVPSQDPNMTAAYN